MTWAFEYASLGVILLTSAYALWVAVTTDSRWSVLPAIFLFLLSLNQISQLYSFRILSRFLDVRIPYWAQAPQSITNMMAAIVVLLLLMHLRQTYVNRTLLREMQHRIKNNLQMVSSLLGLQASQSGDPNVQRELEAARDRLQSMAFLHVQLSKEHKDHIQFETYVRNLVEGIVPDDDPDVRPNLEVSSEHLPPNTSLICGLIINELVTNALQHARTDTDHDNPLVIGVIFHPAGEGEYRLEVTDNGPGLPADTDLETTDSFGLNIVRELVREELGGTVEVLGNDGTTFRIQFPDQR